MLWVKKLKHVPDKQNRIKTVNSSFHLLNYIVVQRDFISKLLFLCIILM